MATASKAEPAELLAAAHERGDQRHEPEMGAVCAAARETVRVSVPAAEARLALKVAFWRGVIGQLPAEDLVDLAVEALVAGLEGAALEALAGASLRDSRALWDLWQEVVAEQGFESVDDQAALWGLVRHTALQVVNGSLDPNLAAAWLWRSASWRLEPEGDLRVFVGLASVVEDHPELQGSLAAKVVEECRSLLARPGPRRWLRLQASQHSLLSLSTNMGPLPLAIAELGLPEDLRARLGDWQLQWRATVDAGGFASADAAERFVAAGAGLATALQYFLGPSWNVEYYPEATRPPGLQLRPTAR